MNINDIISFFSEDYKKKLEAKRQARMNYLLERHLGVSDPSLRDKNGILKKQGLGGFYTDSLPYTLEDYLNERSPEFMKLIREPPRGRSAYEIESNWTDPPLPPKGKYI